MYTGFQKKKKKEKYLPSTEFAYNNCYQSTIGMSLFWTLYGRRCISLIYWEEVEDRRLLGPDVVQETTKKKIVMIRKRMKATQSRQTSYADQPRRPLEFTEGDRVFLKVSPMKGIVRTGRKNKLDPHCVGHFERLEKIGPLEYRLALPWRWRSFTMCFVYLD